MSYRNQGLVDLEYTFNVDTSKLEERLDDIEGKLNQDGTIEDKVNEVLDGRDFADKSDVEDIVRHMMHSEGEEFVQGVIDGNDFVTNDDVDLKIRDTISNEGYPDESRVETMIQDALDNSEYIVSSDVRDIIEEMGLGTDDVADAEEVEKLTARVVDLERRLEVYANRADQIRDLAERMATLEEHNTVAMQFFGLIQRAFELLRAQR